MMSDFEQDPIQASCGDQSVPHRLTELIEQQAPVPKCNWKIGR